MGILDYDTRADAERERRLNEREPRRPQTRHAYIVGLDLGQRSDYTAVAILESSPHDDILMLRRLERVRDRPYPELARLVAATMQALGPEATLLVDVTGVGRPVCDQLSTLGVRHTRISIHGGATVGRLDDGTVSVPKRDLISELVIRFEQKTLLIPRLMRNARMLEREATAFQMKISAAGHDSYNARSGEHDDLLLAVALPVWWRRSQGRAGVWFA